MLILGSEKTQHCPFVFLTLKCKRNGTEGLCVLSKFPTPEAASQAVIHLGLEYSQVIFNNRIFKYSII